MAEPFTIQYGPWVPDLQNVSTQLQNQGGTAVPVADCLNVYYQDGAYRCLPAPAAVGPALSAACLNALSWYDNVASQEVLFTATANGIFSFIDRVPTAVPIETSATVSVSGINISLRIAGTSKVSSLAMNLKTGAVTGRGGLYFNGTLKAQTLGTYTGYAQSSFGTLTPINDSSGNVITSITSNSSGGGVQGQGQVTLQMAARLNQNYFTSLKFPALGITLNTANASSYSQSAPPAPAASIWTWFGTIGLIAGNSYSMQLVA